ncbi:MAG TPA: WXG100 family type VII secretion target [Anaerolineales bacterium]|nr:WXG100 family type VII secretion target [Anaerolineales bacterium]
MAILIIKLDFDAFKNIEGSFRAQETSTKETIGKLNKVIEQLRGGDWYGEGATKFFNEVDSQVIPSMKNLQNVMGEGDRISKEIEKTQHECESAITSLFGNIPGLGLS